jgi:hypothetical protein
VCSKFTTSASIIYDEYFAQLLKDMDDNITETEYSKTSRSWKPVSFAAEEDDDDDGSDGDGPPQPRITSIQSVPASGKRKSIEGLVNLISDDEDDDTETTASAKRTKTNSIVEQLIRNDSPGVSGQADNICTSSQPTTAAQLQSPMAPENNTFPLQQLSSFVMDDQASTLYGNIPSTAIATTMVSSEVLRPQESAHTPSHPPDVNEALSSSVKATTATAPLTYPIITPTSSEPEPMMTRAPFPSYPNHSSMSPSAIRNSFKQKAPCSIYLPKRKLSRS